MIRDIASPLGRLLSGVLVEAAKIAAGLAVIWLLLNAAAYIIDLLSGAVLMAICAIGIWAMGGRWLWRLIELAVTYNENM